MGAAEIGQSAVGDSTGFWSNTRKKNTANFLVFSLLANLRFSFQSLSLLLVNLRPPQDSLAPLTLTSLHFLPPPPSSSCSSSSSSWSGANFVPNLPSFSFLGVASRAHWANLIKKSDSPVTETRKNNSLQQKYFVSFGLRYVASFFLCRIPHLQLVLECSKCLCR